MNERASDDTAAIVTALRESSQTALSIPPVGI